FRADHPLSKVGNSLDRSQLSGAGGGGPPLSEVVYQAIVKHALRPSRGTKLLAHIHPTTKKRTVASKIFEVVKASIPDCNDGDITMAALQLVDRGIISPASPTSCDFLNNDEAWIFDHSIPFDEDASRLSISSRVRNNIPGFRKKSRSPTRHSRNPSASSPLDAFEPSSPSSPGSIGSSGSSDFSISPTASSSISSLQFLPSSGLQYSASGSSVALPPLTSDGSLDVVVKSSSSLRHNGHLTASAAAASTMEKWRPPVLLHPHASFLASLWVVFCENSSLQHVACFPLLLGLSYVFGVVATWVCLALTLGLYWHRQSQERYHARHVEFIQMIRSSYQASQEHLSEEIISPKGMVNAIIRNLWGNLRTSQVPVVFKVINEQLAELLQNLQDDGVTELELVTLEPGDLSPVLLSFSTPVSAAGDTLSFDAHVCFHSSPEAAVAIKVKVKGVGFKIKIGDVIFALNLHVDVAWNKEQPQNSEVDVTLNARPQISLHFLSGAPFPGMSLMAARKLEDAMMERMSPPMSLHIQLGDSPHRQPQPLPTSPITAVNALVGHPGEFISGKSPDGSLVLSHTVSGQSASFSAEKEVSKAIFLAVLRPHALAASASRPSAPITALGLCRVPSDGSSPPLSWRIECTLVFPTTRRAKRAAGLRRKFTKQLWVLSRSVPGQPVVCDLKVVLDRKPSIHERAPPHYQIVRWVDSLGHVLRREFKPIKGTGGRNFFLCYYTTPWPATPETPSSASTSSTSSSSTMDSEQQSPSPVIPARKMVISAPPPVQAGLQRASPASDPLFSEQQGMDSPNISHRERFKRQETQREFLEALASRVDPNWKGKGRTLTRVKPLMVHEAPV
ncbi:MAG: hypothetical protein Q8P67_12005, partial [archaeon]|nr:hypothetical protein [archaeon]